MTRPTYTARCTRTGKWWAIQVPEVDGVWTQTRRLDQAETMARDAVAAVLDVAPDDFDVTMETVLPEDDLEALVASVRARRQQADVAQREANSEMERAVHRLRDEAGLSLRDIAELLGVSHQRIGQLSRR